MTRIDEDVLSHHFEVALSVAAPALLDGLTDGDRYRRHEAIIGIARHLVERMRGFDIRGDDLGASPADHPSLFPDDPGSSSHAVIDRSPH